MHRGALQKSAFIVAIFGVIRYLAERRNTSIVYVHGAFLSTCQGSNPLWTISARVGGEDL